MDKLKTKKEVNSLAMLFVAVYMVSYITRINFRTIISEMVGATGIEKSLLSLSVTGMNITYGLGQILSGLSGDKFSPKKLISAGFLVTMLMNFLIPFCSGPYQMFVVWCINGLAQAFMWPPLVTLMIALLSDDDYKKVAVKVSWGSSFGTILIYIFAPLIITVSGWKAVFFVASACALIMFFVWNKYAVDISVKKQKISEENKSSGIMKIIFSPVMLLLFAAIILQGILRDGVTAWVPSYISETFNLSSVISILSGVLLPLFGILSFQAASVMYRKIFTNPLVCSGVLFTVGTVSALLLYLFPNTGAALSLLLSSVLTGCMHGVNLLLVCMVPAFFTKFGNVSTFTGIINSCTYIGSAISIYGIAVISDKFGWGITLLSWLVTAAAGTVICFALARPWAKKFSA